MNSKKFFNYLKYNYSALFIFGFIFLLWLCVIMSIVNKERFASVIGNLAFYFLIIGIVLKIIEAKLWR